MVKIHLCLTLWIFSTLNWPFTIARLRKGDTADHEHVHIKVHVPEVLRKHTHQHYKTQRLTHPHFVKRFPLHYGNVGGNVDVDVDDDEYDTHAIFEPYDLVQPAPLPLLTSEHEFVAHMGAAGLPLANNDIINNNLAKKQQKQQKQLLQPQIRLPAIIPPSPLSLPMTVPIPMPMPASQALYATEAADPFATHTNINNYGQHDDNNDDDNDDFLSYANNNNNNYNTLTSTLLSAANVNKKKKQQKREKKRKRITIANNNNNNNNFKDNSHKYYVNEQQEEEYAPQLRQAFQPYISTNQPYGNSYGNTYKNNIYSNEDSSNYGKKYKLSSIVPSFAATFDAPADADSNADVENSSEEEQDINEDVDSTFKASFLQPTESASVEHYHQQQQQQPGKSFTQAFGGSTGNGNGFSPVSYQQLFATYAATPATNHLSTQPTTRLKFKRQHPMQQQQQPHTKQIRQQFVQLSSMAPIVAADIDGFHSTVLAPITTNKIYEPMSSIAHTQQPTKRIKQRYIKRKNRIKVKRNRL